MVRDYDSILARREKRRPTRNEIESRLARFVVIVEDCWLFWTKLSSFIVRYLFVNIEEAVPTVDTGCELYIFNFKSGDVLQNNTPIDSLFILFGF